MRAVVQQHMEGITLATPGIKQQDAHPYQQELKR